MMRDVGNNVGRLPIALYQLIDITVATLRDVEDEMHSTQPAALPSNRIDRSLEEKQIFRPLLFAKPATPDRRPAARPRIVKKADPEFSHASLAEDAESFLQTIAGDRNDLDSPFRWCQSIANSVRRTSRAQHLKANALSHAFLLRVDNLPKRELVLKELERAIGRKRSARTSALHIVIENFVEYATGTPAERAAARKLVSRDTRAVEHLREKRILPSQVEALSRKKGEGLDQWSRRAAVPRQMQQKSSLSPRQEAQERSLRHVVLHVVRDADGTEVERERIVVTNALADEVKTSLERLKKLGA